MKKQLIDKPDHISSLSYVDFMALLEECNRPPGGKNSIRRIAINSFLTKDSKVLHIGCNTGTSTRAISSYTSCDIHGIDIAPTMIKAAKKLTKEELLDSRVKFSVQNAERLTFKNSVFDLVFSAGSIAFMKDHKKVVDEILRVLKVYGFFSDTVMYYKKYPPTKLINILNRTMGISIRKWDLSYWKNLYKHKNLNDHYVFKDSFNVPSDSEIKKYSFEMTRKLPFNKSVRSAANDRLYKTMKLFSENNKYLAYAILIYQKTPVEEQISLFGS